MNKNDQRKFNNKHTPANEYTKDDLSRWFMARHDR